MSDPRPALKGKLLICIPFYFVQNRLQYLSSSLDSVAELADQVEVIVITNAKSRHEIDLIKSSLPVNVQSIRVVTPEYIGHPYFLTWSHLDLFREALQSDQVPDYFMYREDDLRITPDNIEYWIEHSRNLNRTSFFPAFLRFEFKSNSSEIFLTDVTERMYLPKLKKFEPDCNYFYVSLKHNYQGWYLLNRKNTQEHLSGLSSNPDFGSWQTREKASQGLNFIEIPSGFHSRNLVAIESATCRVDSRILVQHLPNNYARDLNSPFGKLSLAELFIVKFNLRKEVSSLRRKFFSSLKRFFRLFIKSYL